ncbi:MAG: hypothetical protein ACLQVY_22185 [Limisphaerales bacterium]
MRAPIDNDYEQLSTFFPLGGGFPLKRKTVSKVWSVAAGGCLLALVFSETSCSSSTAVGHPQSSVKMISPTEAASLAAKLANDECERLYKRRPFGAHQHRAVLQNGEYYWGGLNEGAPGGYSALVAFARDGSHPKVEVYFSTDSALF